MTIVLILAVMLSACAPTATQQPAAQEQPVQAPTQAPAAKKVAKFIWTQEFDTLNPYYTNMWFSKVTHQIWECWAWSFTDQNLPQPVLVKEMPSLENGGISADGKVITLKLRDDLKWSDGEPITSDDFLFTYQMVTNPKNTVASVKPYDNLAKLETPDKTTVVMTFNQPFAAWAGTFWQGVLPAHVLRPVFEKDGTLDNADWNRNPKVGCGPYVLAEWQSGSFARFTANENYWLGKPKIDEIYFQFVPDDAAQVAALKTGDGDLGTFIAPSDVPTLEEGGINVMMVFSGYNEGWFFYLDPQKGHPALQDVRVRQAIALAFDRFKLNKDLLLDRTKPAATYWDNTPYADPSVQPWPYDVEKAKQLLDEAGWKDTNGDGIRDKDGVELVLKYGTPTREIRQNTQAVAQQALAQVGIKTELFNYNSDTFFSGFDQNGPAASGQLDIMEWSDTPEFPDPNTSYWLCSEIPTSEKPSGVNWQALCDQELNDLFELQATQVDFKERQQTFYKISKMIFDKVYWLGIWQDPDSFAIGQRLQNVHISGTTPFYNIMEWELK